MALQVLNRPQGQQTTLGMAPVQQPVSPLTVTRQPRQQTLSQLIVSSPSQPSFNPKVQSQPAQSQQINVDNSPRFAPIGEAVKKKYPGVYDDMDAGQLGKSVATKYPGVYDDLITPAYTEPQPEKKGLGFGGTVKELLKFGLSGGLMPNEISKGALKGLGHTVISTAQLGTKALEKITGLDSGTHELGSRIEDKLKPANGAQKLGYYGEQAAEFFAPAGAVGKLGKAADLGIEGLNLGSKATKAFQFGSKMGIGALESGAVTALQGGDTKEVKNAAIFGGAFPIAVKSIGAIGGAGKEVAKFVSSTLSGVPKDAIEYALKNPERVQGAITRAASEGGEAATQRIYQDAVEALDELKNARRLHYEQGLSKLEKEATYSKKGQLYVKRVLTDAEARATNGYVPGTQIGVPTNLSTSGVKQVATTTLKDFGIQAKGRVIDWSEAPIDNAHGKKLQELITRVYNWKNLTPTGLNNLRKVIDSYKLGGINLGSSEKQFNAIIGAVRTNLSEYVGTRIPQVAEMNAKYAAESKVIDSVRKQLSLGSANPNTALRKLINVFNPKSQVYRPIVEQLGEKAGVDMMSDIAALTMLRWTPEGLGKYLTGLSTGAGIGLGFVNPAALATLPATAAMSSPRIVGKAATTFGRIGTSQALKEGASRFGRGLGNQLIR